MKNEIVAVPVFNDRISPLLDVANTFVIYKIVNSEIGSRIVLDVRADCERRRMERLRDMGVNLIIGGAVSGFVSHIITEEGMRLISWVNGNVDEVVSSYLCDRLGVCGENGHGSGKKRRHGKCDGKARKQGRCTTNEMEELQ